MYLFLAHGVDEKKRHYPNLTHGCYRDLKYINTKYEEMYSVLELILKVLYKDGIIYFSIQQSM